MGEGGDLSCVDLRRSYRSGTHKLLRDFYMPCMESAVHYSRAVGYFTGSALSAAAAGLNRFIERGGSMRLVASPFLEADDIEEIETGYELRAGAIDRAVIRELDAGVGDEVTHVRIGFLAYLVATSRLDIKLALVRTARGYGIYHEKMGLFEDSLGNMVVFSGSANETVGGLVSNFESIDVYCSWKPEDADRVQEKRANFEDLWNDRTRNLRVLPFPDAAREELVRLRPERIPEMDPAEADPLDEDELPESGAITVARPSGPWGLPRVPATIQIRDYQSLAARNWFSAKGSGVWRMATGTGKTIAALSLVSSLHMSLLEAAGSLFVVVLCPFIHLVDQWAEVAEEFGILPIRCYQSKRIWAPDLESAVTAISRKYANFAMAISTYDTFRTQAFQESLQRVPSDSVMVVGDEVHGLGATDMLGTLPVAARYRLGLSATPERWFDPEGTSALLSYFGGIVYELHLGDAISMGALTHYDYYPVEVGLTDWEMQRYVDLTYKIAKAMPHDGDPSERQIQASPAQILLVQRARLVSTAQQKLEATRVLTAPLCDTTHNLFYCGDGRVEVDSDEPGRRQVEEVVRLLGIDIGMSAHAYIADTELSKRSEVRRRFTEGTLQALVAIRCLDEGVDIPETRRAFILASSANPKQWIQRRGRVLRRAPGKSKAEIFDLLVTPDSRSWDDALFNTERKLLKRELERVVRFAELADNGEEALHQLLPLRKRYNLLDIG